MKKEVAKTEMRNVQGGFNPIYSIAEEKFRDDAIQPSPQGPIYCMVVVSPMCK